MGIAGVGVGTGTSEDDSDRPRNLSLARAPESVAQPAPSPMGAREVGHWSCDLVLPPEGIGGTSVMALYRGLPGNQPQLYGNSVAIWEGTVVPFTIPPIERLPIEVGASEGSVALGGTEITRDAYTVAYAVGPAPSDIAVASTFGAQGQTLGTRRVDLSIRAAGPTSLVVRYSTLPGYRPMKAGNWLGLWRGEVSPYDAPDPVARVDVGADVNEDDLSLNGIVLADGFLYTLAYHLGAAPTTAAVLVTFALETP
jgi:hypothetical protein